MFLSKTFDSTDHKSLIYKLQSIELSNNSQKYWHFFELKSTQRFFLNKSLSDSLELTRKWKLLRPILFNIYVDDIGGHKLNIFIIVAHETIEKAAELRNRQFFFRPCMRTRIEVKHSIYFFTFKKSDNKNFVAKSSLQRQTRKSMREHLRSCFKTIAQLPFSKNCRYEWNSLKKPIQKVQITQKVKSFIATEDTVRSLLSHIPVKFIKIF